MLPLALALWGAATTATTRQGGGHDAIIDTAPSAGSLLSAIASTWSGGVAGDESGPSPPSRAVDPKARPSERHKQQASPRRGSAPPTPRAAS